MTILLASLIARLTADVPAQSGVPSSDQYTQAVKDAIADLSRRASVPRVATLAIVANQASYDLPADFEKLIRLAQIGVPFGSSYLDYGVYGGPGWSGYGNYEGYGGLHGGTLVTSAGLVPFAGSYREQITVAGGQLTIYPTPQVSADRQLIYAAGDALVGSEYPTLTDDRASVALLLASATCLERIVAGGVGVADKVEGLGFAVDARTAGTALRTQAQGLRDQYLAAVASLNAAIGGLS